jgi:hypothetical protein
MAIEYMSIMNHEDDDDSLSASASSSPTTARNAPVTYMTMMIIERSFHHITNTQHPTTTLAQLSDTTDVIQLMTKAESGLQMKPPSFTTSLFEEFETLSTLDLTSMFVDR